MKHNANLIENIKKLLESGFVTEMIKKNRTEYNNEFKHYSDLNIEIEGVDSIDYDRKKNCYCKDGKEIKSEDLKTIKNEKSINLPLLVQVIFFAKNGDLDLRNFKKYWKKHFYKNITLEQVTNTLYAYDSTKYLPINKYRALLGNIVDVQNDEIDNLNTYLYTMNILESYLDNYIDNYTDNDIRNNQIETIKGVYRKTILIALNDIAEKISKNIILKKQTNLKDYTCLAYSKLTNNYSLGVSTANWTPMFYTIIDNKDGKNGKRWYCTFDSNNISIAQKLYETILNTLLKEEDTFRYVLSLKSTNDKESKIQELKENIFNSVKYLSLEYNLKAEEYAEQILFPTWCNNYQIAYYPIQEQSALKPIFLKEKKFKRPDFHILMEEKYYYVDVKTVLLKEMKEDLYLNNVKRNEYEYYPSIYFAIYKHATQPDVQNKENTDIEDGLIDKYNNYNSVKEFQNKIITLNTGNVSFLEPFFVELNRTYTSENDNVKINKETFFLSEKISEVFLANNDTNTDEML